MSVFPQNFFWGAATASYQVEGWNENTDWAVAAKENRVPKAGRLADHYHRYEEDFDIAKELGHNAHRFSIEWARIEPEEGQFNFEEIEHYRAVLTALRKRDIEPFITLWHFTLPTWFAESGGFERRDAPVIFARYCEFVTRELGDLCTQFTTMNEPNVYATHGWLYGAWPPFKRVRIGWKKIGKEDGTSVKARAEARFKHLFQYFRVTRILAEAHNQAYDAIKSAVPNAQVSIVKHVHYFHADTAWHHKLKARLMVYFQNHQFMKRIIDRVDVIGLNYYRATKYGDDKNYLKTDMGWKAYPSGIYGALMLLKRYQKPVVISEAGLADADDDLRAQYIGLQIDGMKRAMTDGVEVIGHMYWSLMDNYEWALGIKKQFGLVKIDYDTLEREIRPSAWVYKELIGENQVS